MAEFTIESRPELIFRTKQISPIDLLALTTTIDFEKFTKTKELYTFALEHLEMKTNDGTTWSYVKVEGREVYNLLIENDLNAINELIIYFLNEVVGKAFTKSSE